MNGEDKIHPSHSYRTNNISTRKYLHLPYETINNCIPEWFKKTIWIRANTSCFICVLIKEIYLDLYPIVGYINIEY